MCSLQDVPELGALRVEVSGPTGEVSVAVVRDADGGLHAISDTCSHQAVSLSEGDVEGCEIECWLHGSSFDLRTGRCLTSVGKTLRCRPAEPADAGVGGDRGSSAAAS